MLVLFSGPQNRRPPAGQTGAAKKAEQRLVRFEKLSAVSAWRLSPVQVQGLHVGSAAVQVRGGRGVCRLPQSVVFRQQLAQVISGEVGSPGSTAVRQGLLPQLLHLQRELRVLTRL